MPGAEEVGERDIVGLVVVHTRLHIGSAAYQPLKYTQSSAVDPNPGSGAILTPGSGIQDPGFGIGKNLGSGSGMNNPDRISQGA
jgi:hypothetical protein